MFINDDYREVGNDYLEFVDTINAMVNRTEVLRLPKSLIKAWTIMSEDDKFFYLAQNGYSTPTFLPGDSAVRQPVPSIKPFAKKKFFDRGMNQALLDEISRSKTFFVMDSKATLFEGEGLWNTLGQRIGLTGKNISEPSFARNEHVQERLDVQTEKPEVYTIVLREQNGVKKWFAAHSDSYPYVPQTILCDIAEKFIAANYGGLGEAKCAEWEVNHHYSTVKLLFPEKAKDIQATYGLPDAIVPGLILTTSDLGENSITCKGIFSVRGSYVVQKEVKKQHKGDVKPDSVVATIDKEVFSEYTKLPARLCELMTIDIADVKYSLDEAFKGLGIRKFGEKTTEKLTEALMMELPAGGSYTAYDLSIAILSLQGRLSDIPVYTKNALEEKCIKAPFLKWEQFAGLSDGDVVVTA